MISVYQDKLQMRTLMNHGEKYSADSNEDQQECFQCQGGGARYNMIYKCIP